MCISVYFPSDKYKKNHVHFTFVLYDLQIVPLSYESRMKIIPTNKTLICESYRRGILWFDVNHMCIIFGSYDLSHMILIRCPFLWSNMKQYDRYIIHRCGAYVAKLPVYIKDIQYDFLLIIASNKQSIGEHQNRKVSLNNYLLNLF